MLSNKKSEELFGLSKLSDVNPFLEAKFLPVLKSCDNLQYESLCTEQRLISLNDLIKKQNSLIEQRGESLE